MFRMPAEWVPHAAVWTAWPHDTEQWLEGLDAPQRALMKMVVAIVDGGRGERVELIVRGDGDENAARALLGPAAEHVRFHHGRYGDSWLRDTGPIFLTGNSNFRDTLPLRADLIAVRFRFDGWGGKYVMAGDTEVAEQVTRWSGAKGSPFDFVLEGGAIDVDGDGTLLTTRQCLLDGVRNPTFSERDYEERLRSALGVERIVWLERGLQNDHTDGHVDTIARFVAAGVVACHAPAAGDPNADVLNAIIRDLRAAKLEVVTVPSPGTVLDASGALMPASYMNFYVANTTVVVPTYGVAADGAAVEAIGKMFTDRRVVGIDGKPVVVGGGAFHCSTQQQPLI